jgi:hypothetical protein
MLPNLANAHRCLCSLFRGVVSASLLAVWLAVSISGASQGLEGQVRLDNPVESCRFTQDDAARLRCDEDASAAKSSESGVAAAGAWRLVRTPNPAGGRDAVSIMRTAEMSQSDVDLAGLMIRCGEAATEVLIVLVRPLPPRAQPTVTVQAGSASAQFNARVVPPGALLLLPPEATALLSGPWQAAPELAVAVADRETISRGVIALGGLGAALSTLRSNCPAQ